MEGYARFAQVWAAAGGRAVNAERMAILNEIWMRDCPLEPLSLAQGQKPLPPFSPVLMPAWIRDGSSPAAPVSCSRCATPALPLQVQASQLAASPHHPQLFPSALGVGPEGSRTFAATDPQRMRQGLSIYTYFYLRLLLDKGEPLRPTTMHLHPGVLVSYSARPDATYQVVNVDDLSDCVWLRSFPLRQQRLPTFGVPLHQVRPISGGVS